MPLDDTLLDYMRARRVVLFLGAGASRGAVSATKEEIPDAIGLGVRICERFLGGKYKDRSFKSICDFAANRRSIRELQEFLHDELEKYNPAAFHQLIPEFAWAGILTTNYDLVIERAYKAAPAALQRLQLLRSDNDVPAGGFDPAALLYVKLHGCVTEFAKVDPPLIASTEQIIDHKTGRASQFAQFLEWAQTKAIVFAGYKAEDENLRVLIQQIIKEGEKRPRHFIVRPDIEGDELQYWEDRRFRAIPLTFEAFLRSLDAAMPSPTRKLAGFAIAPTSTTFARHISVPGASESEALKKYLTTDCEHVSTSTAAPSYDSRRFYNGFDVGWFAMQADLDVSRRVTRAILKEQIVAAADTTPARLIVLKAHAGAGKSVILRRIAWDAARSHDRLVLFVNQLGRVDVERFEEMFSLTNRAIFLIVDKVAQFAETIQVLITKARARKWPLVVICAERINEWNISCDDLDDEVDVEYDLKYLSKVEIDELLVKLEAHNSLGFLKSIAKQERAAYLQEQFGRQLLVALHEATKNANFRDIVANEYKNIVPIEARLLYLDICALNRYGSPVRAGLVARVHGIDFNDFRERFFKPLEEVVELRMDHRIGDYTYAARHPLIAEFVYSSSLVTMDERFDNIMRIVGKLNPTYSYDREVLSHLTRANTLDDLFSDRRKGEAIYTSAASAFGETPVLLHQWGLYEMRRAGDSSGLDRAERLIERAVEAEPHNRAMRHSLAELALRRSRLAEGASEREAWREDAITKARKLVTGNSSFPFHTLAKAAIDQVADALGRYESQPDELAELAVDEAIKNAEDVLRRGLQRFPNDDRLLTAEADLSRVLNNAQRAGDALTKAFKSNPRSELVAKRLAKVQLAQNDLLGATQTLRAALSFNPGSQSLHYDMATCLRRSSPNADQTECEAILFHYSRAFVPGDKNYEAQFWCARQYWLKGDDAGSRALFEALKRIRLPYKQRDDIRGTVVDGTGMPVRFNGQVATVSDSYCFIRMDGRSYDLHHAMSANGDGLAVRRGERVTFEAAFSFFGPQAVNLETLLI